ncbi:hypothetical protein BDV12DRAFT_162114 [Aspergillus spectabilis]
MLIPSSQQTPVVLNALIKSTISRGLHLLHTVIPKMKDRADLFSTMVSNVSGPVNGFLDSESLNKGNLARLRSGHDRQQEWRTPIPFEKDRLFDPKELSKLFPPFAWTLLWRGTYSNLYGYCVPVDIRRWGYILWDKKRLENTCADELLLRQWQVRWGHHDPRDLL